MGFGQSLAVEITTRRLSSHLMKTPDIVVLGDINLDWVVSGHLPFRFSELQENGVITWAPIEELPGGSGLNFAWLARKAGYSSVLLAKTGADAAARFLRAWLQEAGIVFPVPEDPSSDTGRAFLVRDGSDIRLLVNNLDNANHKLGTSDVEPHLEDIESCRVLYISGYCVMDDTAPRFRATGRALEIACAQRTSGIPIVVFDVVPHRIYEKYTFDIFKLLTKHVQIVISEVATIRRFLGLGSRLEVVDRVIAEETLKYLKPHYRQCILRWGPSGCDEQLLWDGTTERLKWEETGHKSANDKRAFGDVLAMRALQTFFEVLPPL